MNQMQIEEAMNNERIASAIHAIKEYMREDDGASRIAIINKVIYSPIRALSQREVMLVAFIAEGISE